MGEFMPRMEEVPPGHVQMNHPFTQLDQYSNILGKTCLKNNKSDDVVTFFTYLPTVKDVFLAKLGQLLPQFDLSPPMQALAVV